MMAQARSMAEVLHDHENTHHGIVMIEAGRRPYGDGPENGPCAAGTKTRVLRPAAIML
jgi:hypothetical protein